MHWSLRMLLGKKDRDGTGGRKKLRVPRFFRVFWKAVRASIADNVPRAGASLAYYTLFAIGPIILIATYVAGVVFGPQAVRGELTGEMQRLVGEQGARAVQSLLVAASQHRSSGVLATVLGSITLALTAIGAFLELQTALNAIWRVKPKPGFSIKSFLMPRLRSFGLVVGIGFLLMVSLVGVPGLRRWANGWAAWRVRTFSGTWWIYW